MKQAFENVATDHELLETVSNFLDAFPGKEVSDDRLANRGQAYVISLEGMPLWAVLRGVKSWLKAENGTGKENYAFAPSPPQLLRLAKLHHGRLGAVRGNINRLLKADPIPEYSDNHCKSMSRKLKNLTDELKRTHSLKKCIYTNPKEPNQ